MATVTRPTAGYTPTNPITNATKYQDDSAATSPRVAISSEKVDGDLNKAFDTLTDHDDRLEVLEDPVTGLTSATPTTSDVVVFADVSDSDAPKRTTLAGVIALFTIPDESVTVAKLADGTANRLLGFDGAGEAAEISVSGGLSLSAGALTGAAATDTAAGVVELATAAEITTRTDTGRVPSVAGLQNIIVHGTAQSPTTGTSVDFTSIPSWAKRITIMFNSLSTSGGSNMQVQLGTGGVATTSGYTMSALNSFTTSAAVTSYTSGFVFNTSNDTARELRGALTLTKFSAASNTWVASGSVASGSDTIWLSSGVVTLGGVLDMVRLTTISGSPTFDSGSVNVCWE